MRHFNYGRIKILGGFFLGIALVLILVTPVYAQNYQLIEPLPYIGESIDSSGSGVFGTYASRVFLIAIGAAAILAVLMIVVGGVQYTYVAISPDSKSAAKDKIRDAIFGLLIVLAAYLVLAAINPDLVSLRLVIPKIGVDGGGTQTPATIPPPSCCPGGAATCAESACTGTGCEFVSVPGTEGIPGAPGSCQLIPGAGVPDFSYYTNEFTTREALEALNISINNTSPCPTDTTYQEYRASTGSGCTSVGSSNTSVSEKIVNGLDNLQSIFLCNCMRLTVTGGTELGHITHNPDSAIVDIRSSDSAGGNLSRFITETGTRSGNWYDITIPGVGNVRFLDERTGGEPHWHVVFPQ